ncbi:MAG TPA: hypothetical protein VGN27_11885 [Gaiellaceae bacterium]|nr:hypothetical protein [Gaiellaceae bacterium]
MGDIFDDEAPPVRLTTTIASPRTVRPRAEPVPVWSTVSKTRGLLTVLLVGGFAWLYLFPAWQIVGLTAAALGCQCVRRWNWVRWASWSLIGASLGAGALALGTWPLRFAACLLLIAPMVWFAGSSLRDV